MFLLSCQHNLNPAMPKLTTKYKSALELGHQLGCTISTLQEGLYLQLNELGYFWDSEEQDWVKSAEPANPPSTVVRVRVWAAGDRVEEEARRIAEIFVEAHDYQLVEKSQQYPCRPPNQKDSRIYLTFLPPT